MVRPPWGPGCATADACANNSCPMAFECPSDMRHDYQCEGHPLLKTNSVRSLANDSARRLQTIMERLVEEVSFTAEDRGGTTLDIDAAYVDGQLSDIVGDTDLSKYVL